jgi:hypothetical protein
MTITAQENQDLPLKENFGLQNVKIQDEPASLSGQDSKQKTKSKTSLLNSLEPKDTRLYYLDKKTNRHKRLSDNIFRDLQYVTRPNDRKKRISLKARNLLTNLIQMILKNPHKEEFVDHKFLSQITEVYSSKQNANLLDQISDIIDSTYHSYINFYGKHKTYGYVIKLTEDGYERAKNPVAFYTDSSGKIFPSESKKISSYIKIKKTQKKR